MARSQNGVAPPHAVELVAVHSTHDPLVGLQAWFDGNRAQSASTPQPTQVIEPSSQTGAPAGQSASARQATQVLLAVSHAGVAPVHAASFVAVHSTQPPVVESQAGVAARPEQSASPTQGWQVFVEGSQAGTLTGQSELAAHSTQVRVAGSHAGVGAAQGRQAGPQASAVSHRSHPPSPHAMGSETRSPISVSPLGASRSAVRFAALLELPQMKSIGPPTSMPAASSADRGTAQSTK